MIKKYLFTISLIIIWITVYIISAYISASVSFTHRNTDIGYKENQYRN